MAKSHYKDEFEIITPCSSVACKLHGVTSQKTVTIIVTTARTSNLIKKEVKHHLKMV